MHSDILRKFTGMSNKSTGGLEARSDIHVGHGQQAHVH